MHILIIGAGGVGAIYGGHLAHSGVQVTLLDINQEHIHQINQHGLTVAGQYGGFTVPVPATADPNSVEPADVALICVNSYDSAHAARAAQRALRPDGYVVTLQNGLGNLESLTDILGAERVVGGLTYHSAALDGPGRVLHTNVGATPLGELSSAQTAATSRLVPLVDALDRAGLNPTVSADIMTTIWGKFVHNCAVNGICALTGLRPGHLQHVPAVNEFQTQVIEEVLRLVKAKGILLEDADPLSTIQAWCKSRFHQPSMMQHIARGQQTEIDALNGYAVAACIKLGLAAPANDALTRLVKGREYVHM